MDDGDGGGDGGKGEVKHFLDCYNFFFETNFLYSKSSSSSSSFFSLWLCVRIWKRFVNAFFVLIPTNNDNVVVVHDVDDDDLPVSSRVYPLRPVIFTRHYYHHYSSSK